MPSPLSCKQSAIQHALDVGGCYTLAGCDVHLSSPLLMSHGRVSLLDGILEGGNNVSEASAVRIFVVTGGDLTLSYVDQQNGSAIVTTASPGDQGSPASAGADGSPGVGSGSAGGQGAPPSAAGGPGGAVPLATPTAPYGRPPPAARGGCMVIAAGAVVHLVGGELLSCDAVGSLGDASGGPGGTGGGGRGGIGGSGDTGGPGGNGAPGSPGGNGGAGGTSLTAEGGAIYNEGSLTVLGTALLGNRALGGKGGQGGNGGNGGAGGNGGLAAGGGTDQAATAATAAWLPRAARAGPAVMGATVSAVRSTTPAICSFPVRVAGPPQFGPPAMKASTTRENVGSEEHVDVATQAHAGADRPQAEGGRLIVELEQLITACENPS
ncbi:MAG: hypothetical protein ACYC91_14740 [Solirubrobacteraceae bacterium]